MRRFILSTALICALSFTAHAQQPYAPPSEALWTQMVEIAKGYSMPLAAHQQIQTLFQQVQAAAQQEAAAKKKPDNAAKP